MTKPEMDPTLYTTNICLSHVLVGHGGGVTGALHFRVDDGKCKQKHNRVSRCFKIVWRSCNENQPKRVFFVFFFSFASYTLSASILINRA